MSDTPPGTTALPFRACCLCDTVTMAPADEDNVLCGACHTTLLDGARELGIIGADEPAAAIQPVVADD